MQWTWDQCWFVISMLSVVYLIWDGMQRSKMRARKRILAGRDEDIAYLMRENKALREERDALRAMPACDGCGRRSNAVISSRKGFLCPNCYAERARLS